MKITKRYLKVPVSRYSSRKSLVFYENNEIFMDYKVQLCIKEPEYYFYIDMRYALGHELSLEIEPYVDFNPEFTDEPVKEKNLYKEKFRPVSHFSAAKGWINDPNGLIYINGIYHMFFQHNPAGPKWSNMHWGHAVSKDLIHWEEKEIALFPDKTGTMYSGCAIADTDNLTGLKENDNDVILLYYTACNADMKLSAGVKTSQCLAYSTDNGETFIKYKNNPVIPNIVDDNRDPKVIYVPEEKCYYMALFLNRDEYCLLNSHNLLDWNIVQTFKLKDDGECPDFYPLVSDKGHRYWIFTGAHDRYLAGKIENSKFVPVQEISKLSYGDKSYAAQTFSGLEDNNRIKIAWNRSVPPESYFNSSMCTPVKMGLSEESDGRLFLTAEPIERIRTNESECDKNCLQGKSHDISIKIQLSQNGEIKISLLGFEFRINANEHIIKINDFTMPLYDENGKAELRLITDTTSVELYSNKYKAYGVYENIADYSLNYISVKNISGNSQFEIKASEIKNIWE